MSWIQTLDLQISLSEWMRSAPGRMFGGGYFASNVAEGETEEVAYNKGTVWAEMLATTVFNAEPIYVEPDMMTVVEAAVDQFRPEPLAETDFITPVGFLVLPRSLWLKDRNGRSMSWRAAVWECRPEGVWMSLLHDTREGPDYFDTPEGRGMLAPDSDGVYARLIKDAPLLVTHTVPWKWGQGHPGYSSAETEAEAESATTVHRQVQGILRLLVQHLAVVEPGRPPRPFVKRARRANLPHDHVTVVRLRRPPQDKEPGEPGTVNWTHRWVVGGHWRNQWYPSVGLHRQIWMSPYVKGPAELPLVVNKARVFALVR